MERGGPERRWNDGTEGRGKGALDTLRRFKYKDVG